ncbi:MAG: 23S rRNA (adenine(2503)-C(2))-methyltransferase RlmN [Candidatus Dormibacteraeota bacterium]|nr:23S rRNA (adenine(2503)-C(2))-methyltransferase RlmN [Candidatus Dormibacteraeota bacterium]
MTVEGAPPAISELTSDELDRWFAEQGEPAYRARQLRRWLAAGAGFEAMDDLPSRLRGRLAEEFRRSSLEEVRRTEADQGLTTKLLYRLRGGYTVEAVIMRYPRRSTLCISSQVGCPIGCPFCATGQAPFGRNLQAHEIADQAVDANRRLGAEGRRLSHVVFMGMGEPLANYDAVLESVRRMADPNGLGISPRRMVISTSGLVPRMERLAGEGLSVTLAVSLHAARDALRDVLVPINRRYPLAQVVGAADRLAQVTGRRVSYEWVLLAGVNDSERDARELGGLLRGRLAHVNLIPFNPVDEAPYREPDPASVRRFSQQLREQGLNVTVRDTRGREGDAACGQLRARSLAEDPSLEARTQQSDLRID